MAFLRASWTAAPSPNSRQRTSRPDGDDVEIAFQADTHLSERVIFPITESQINGIEDARFVEFESEGRKTYYPKKRSWLSWPRTLEAATQLFGVLGGGHAGAVRRGGARNWQPFSQDRAA